MRKVGAVLLILAASSRAAADPAPDTSDYVHIAAASLVRTDTGSEMRLPPGYFLSEPAHDRVDAEFRRLRDLETKLVAENKSLRASAQEWQPGWKLLTAALVAGFAGGLYVYAKFDD